MLTHSGIWRAIDALADRHGLTPSALARQAGLDPTTFNRSKRGGLGEGKLRWPSTESLAKALAAVGEPFDAFAALTEHSGEGRPTYLVPLLGWPDAGDPGAFDETGRPTGEHWDAIGFPDRLGEETFALEVSGRAMEPVYRDGDRLIVAPNEPVRRGDRVVVKTRPGEVMANELARLTQNRVELRSLNPDYPDRVFERDALLWISRIIWSSQ
ncbi:MAG: helix-turn-helix transcriptional regulator [Maricaulaceae bacterium]